MMKLWTIQPVEVMDIVNTTGIFRCDEDKSDNFKDFHDAYLWLVKQMDARNIKHPSDVELPLWAWHTRNWEHKKPDLRNIGYGIAGEQYVCIEFEIDTLICVLPLFYKGLCNFNNLSKTYLGQWICQFLPKYCNHRKARNSLFAAYFASFIHSSHLCIISS